MRRSLSTGQRLRVQNMSETIQERADRTNPYLLTTKKEGETMQEMMEREMAEAVATLNRANRAFDRLFGTQEGEGEE
jgi:hypothetical protein